MQVTTGIFGGTAAVEGSKISLGKEAQDSSSQPLPYGQPLVFDQKRKSGCGCCIWLLILLLLAGAGGTVSWYFLDSNDRMLIKNGLSSLIEGTPLDFLRNHIMPRLETKPPLPPINESGDHGVITLPARPAAPAAQDAIQPKSAEDERTAEDNAAEGNVLYQKIEKDDETAANTLPKEDTRVHPLFIRDLASYIVSRYKPLSGNRGGTLSISVQSLNQRYAKTPVGLEAKDGAKGREALLRYCFTPSMIQGLYAIYSDSFLQAVADAASSKKLSSQEQSALFQTIGSRCLILASGLEAVASMPDLGRRLTELDQAEQACVLSNRQLLDARFDLDRALDTGAGQQETAKARETVSAAQRALQEATRKNARTQEQFIASLRSQSGTTLNEDSLLYLARWVGRRLKENNEALQGAMASSHMLKALARRCAVVAREGLPDATRQNNGEAQDTTALPLQQKNPPLQNKPFNQTRTNQPQQQN